MDKKSFLRGFGTGVLFAAAILGISFTVRTSESAIISRAEKLGMTFASQDDKINFADAKPASGAATDAVEGKNKNQEKKAEATSTPDAKAKADDNKKKDKSFEEEKKKIEDEQKEISKTLIINDGDWSGEVSRQLEALGIIDSAEDFDIYLNNNGYSESINSGQYDISIDATYDEIAREITSGF